MAKSDPYPSSDFDEWAETYDEDVVACGLFPFAGYERALTTVLELASPTSGMSVLDLGTGTGNLAALFSARGCDVWGSDYSELMLDRARCKLPDARFVLHDLRATWPSQLDRRFDRIVSAYAFHHFTLEEKVRLCREIVQHRLAPGGRLVIADLSFPNRTTMEAFAQSVPDLWEDELYWLADEALAGLEAVGIETGYLQVSPCASVYSMGA
jgi:putative AdoMet-dependent methyltransferase